MADLSVNYCGFRFKNPVLMSSADHTWTMDQFKMAFKNGAAGVVTKSLSSGEEMRQQFDLVEHAIINENRELCKGKIPPLFTLYGRSGMVQEQPDEWIDKLVKAQKFADGYDGIVVGSVHGTTIDSWVRTSKMMEQAGLKMIELDAGCPHPDEMKEVKDSLVRDIIFAGRLAKEVKAAVKVPVIVKLTPQIPDLVEAAKEVKDNAGDAVVINNRFLGFLVDIETGKPYLNGWAGVGGPWVLPLSLRWVSKVYKAVDIQISGSAGPKDWRDVVQFMMSGATTVQFCSAIMVHGYDILPEIVSGFSKFLDRKGYKKAEDIIGIAANSAMEYSVMYDLKQRALIDYDSCTTCKRCIETCWYNGLVFEDGKVKVTDSCKGCQVCRMVCPVPGTITMEGGKIPFKKLEPQIW